MRFKSHVAISLGTSAIGYACTNSIAFSLGMLVTGIFMDIDHFLDYCVAVEKIRFDIKDLFQQCYEFKIKKSYLLFHSVELIPIMLLIYLLSGNILLLGVIISFILHLFLDMLSNHVYLFGYSFIHRWKNNFSSDKVFNVKLKRSILNGKNKTSG